MRERIDRIKNAAEGHWPEIFASVGMDAALFQRQNRPCPLCGGRDRFSFFAKEVGGRWYCRGCGMGDGIKLVQQFTKKEFVQTLVHLETLLGLPVPKGKQGRYERSAVARHKLWAEKQRAEQSALWEKAFPLGEIDRQTPVWRYLCARGLGDLVPSRELRFVKKLACWEVPDGQNIDGAAKARLVGEFPAMLARLTNAEGKFITLHRTYLTADGSKAPVHSAKKLAAGAVENGVIRLYPAGGVVCLAEGIETALSVHALTGMKRFGPETIPDGVRTIRICGDNDRSYAGAAGAYELASRLRRSRPELEVSVHIPQAAGTDWNDVLLAHGMLKL